MTYYKSRGRGTVIITELEGPVKDGNDESVQGWNDGGQDYDGI